MTGIPIKGVGMKACHEGIPIRTMGWWPRLSVVVSRFFGAGGWGGGGGMGDWLRGERKVHQYM